MSQPARFDYQNYDFFATMPKATHSIPVKYIDRAFNYYRELHRAEFLDARFGTEFLNDNVSLDILSVSAGAMGTYDVMKDYNNQVVSTDFLKPHLYQPMAQYFGHEVQHFDGHNPDWKLFEEKQFDYVTIFQAIEFFAGSQNWHAAIDRFKKFARKGVIVIFNTSEFSMRSRNNDPLKLVSQRVSGLELAHNPSDFPVAFVSIENDPKVQSVELI